MAKKLPPPVNDNKKIHIKVEEWQWTGRASSLTWKHWLGLTLLLSVAISFAFGFLIIAGVVLIGAIVINLVLFVLRKLP
jgi:hypothetical protein